MVTFLSACFFGGFVTAGFLYIPVWIYCIVKKSVDCGSDFV